MSECNTIQVTVGELLFELTDKQMWIDKGPSWFRNCNAGLPRYRRGTLCVDATGHICTHGVDFQSATWPVRVFRTYTAVAQPHIG